MIDQWRDVGRDAVRAFSGGMIFGVPLLFTMEVWHAGAQASPPRLLLVLFAAAVLVFLLVRLVGFWSRPARDVSEGLVQAVQAVGLALVSVTAVLVVLGRLTRQMPLSDAVGIVVYEAIPFAVGAAIASAAGLLAVVGLSLVVSYTVVFASGFFNERKRRTQVGVLQRPVAETLASYVVALVVSALMLWMFDNLALGEPLREMVSRVLVLGLPAAVGGSAGRLVA